MTVSPCLSDFGLSLKCALIACTSGRWHALLGRMPPLASQYRAGIAVSNSVGRVCLFEARFSRKRRRTEDIANACIPNSHLYFCYHVKKSSVWISQGWSYIQKAFLASIRKDRFMKVSLPQDTKITELLLQSLKNKKVLGILGDYIEDKGQEASKVRQSLDEALKQLMPHQGNPHSEYFTVMVN